MKELINVVIVEDDPDDCELVRHQLAPRADNPFQFQLESADSLRAALKLLDEKPADVLLLDLSLPDSRGIETYRTLQAAHPRLPIVVLTGLSDEALALDTVRAGAQDYLVKGSLADTLLQRALRYAVERSRFSSGFEDAFQKAPDATILVGPDARVQYLNPAAAALFGRELVGKTFPYPEALERAKEIRAKIAGEQRTIELRPSEVMWRNGPATLVWARDLTEVKKLSQVQAEVRERRRLDQLKDQLMNTVSHELRSPLSIVEAAIENLAEGLGGPLPEKAKELVEMAARHSERLVKVVGNLLELARLESGKSKLNRARVQLNRLIPDTVSGYRLLAANKNIAILDAVPVGIPDVDADADLLVQLLGNLLDNGLRFARTKIEVSARAVAAAPVGGGAAPESAAVQITVADDGPGIEAADLEKLFDRFVQVQRVSQSGYKGTGLGLTICKEIAERHGGRIWAESSPGRGTRMCFILPAAR